MTETECKNKKSVSFSESLEEYNTEKVDEVSDNLDDTLEINEISEGSQTNVNSRPPDV